MTFDSVRADEYRAAFGQHTAAGQEALRGDALRAKLRAAWRFTEAYRKHLGDPVAIREAHCLAEQYPAMCREIRDYDLIAGRLHYTPLVGFVLENVLNFEIEPLQTDRRPDASLTPA